MRVHRLEIEAFGAFVDRQMIDVDTLAAQHLFLLHGETGAGKTTVLDALCFGLYGEVPGARNGAGHLRSDHAAPDAAPQVVVELTVRGRRFRLTRSPKWLRPKKRGAGLTPENASVTAQELVDGEWMHLSSRIDETNQLMVDLIGLTPQQFCQVVLLPQGSFATFLRANSDERRTLLQKIFSTSRFADIEQWLVERRKDAKRESDRHHETVRSLMARLTEAAATDWPDVWPENDLTAPAATGDLREYADELITATTLACDHAVRGRDGASSAVTGLREEHARASRLAEQAARAREAYAALRDLEQCAERLEHVQARCDAARRARPVVHALDHVRRASAAEERASRAVSEARAAASTPLAVHAVGSNVSTSTDTSTDAHPASRAAVEAARDAAARRRSEAAALVAVEQEHRHARRRADEAERLSIALAAEVAALESDLAALPAQREVIVASLAQLRPVVASLPALAVEATTAKARAEAAAEVTTRTQQVVRAEERLLDLRTEAADRRDELHACRERRFAGMASEIALKLAVGQGCPVCGSCEHPSPAPRDRVDETRAAEESARTAYENATFAQQVAEQDLAGLRSHRDAALRASDGVDEATAHARSHEAARRLDEAQQGACRLAESEEALADLDARCRTAESAIAEKREALAGHQASRTQLEERASSALARIEQTLAAFDEQTPTGTDGCPDASSGAERWSAWFTSHVALLGAYADALVHLASAAQQQAEADAHLAETVAASGFDDAHAAAEAHLDDTAISRLTDELQQADRRRHTAQATLAEMPDGIDDVLAGRTSVPDAAELAARLASLEEQHDAANATAEALLRQRARVEHLAVSLTAALDAWAPVRQQFRAVADLAETAEGKGSDNPFQMRLSAYVLASRLSQVVAAANERLASMAEQRYELEHTAFKSAGDRRGGLSLRVVDAWTGESRDPATLSGGETFVVALALALGLADVVTAEAGGAEIETLFVDEGFGSLDPHTLDRVMDCLDDLRSGGRSVGVVSHVAEMRDRIPDQLHVLKTPHGSQVRMTLAATAAS